MEKLVTRWLISAASIAIVAWLLPGIHVGRGPDGLLTILVGAALLGLMNTIIKPLLMLLSCPLILLTFGLFLLVINAWTLMLASSLSRALGFPFSVAGWGTAVFGAVLISVVSWILSSFVPDSRKKDDHHE